jgi:hypothetical protein
MSLLDFYASTGQLHFWGATSLGGARIAEQGGQPNSLSADGHDGGANQIIEDNRWRWRRIHYKKGGAGSGPTLDFSFLLSS